MVLKLTGITIYPLKSGAGLARESFGVGEQGLHHDRRWMVVDPSGKFLTQRSHPRLALVRADLGDGGELTLRGPRMAALAVPVPPADGDRLEVQIWRDRLAASLAGGRADAWLTRFLETPCRLVHMSDRARRALPAKYGKAGVPSAAPAVSFADGFPYLLTSADSLADLNRRLARPVDMRRFRPNLVVAGAEPYAEDAWKRLRIGDIEFRAAKPCSRCRVVCVDPETGVAEVEPLKTLVRNRTRGGKVLFGINLIAENTGRLKVGDRVKILS